GVIASQNPDRGDIDQLKTAASAFLNFILQKGQTQIKSQKLSCGSHLQFTAKSSQEVVMPLFNKEVFSLLDGEIDFPSIWMTRQKASIAIVKSIIYANALFVTIIREYSSDDSFEHLAAVFRKDQENLLKVLNLEMAQ